MSDSDDIGPGFRAYIIVMLALALVSVTLRFWSRSLNRNTGRHSSRFWWDDWVALAATVVLIGQQAVILGWINLGFGRHIWTLPPEDLSIFFKLVFASYFLYDTALFLTKASALLFLSRIFPKFTNSKIFNVALWITHGLNAAWLLGIVFGSVFFCDPVAKNWNPTLDGTCGTNTDLFIGSAVPSVAIDLIILLLPLPKVWRLQTSNVRKGAITGVFVLGYCVIILSLGRLVTVLTSGDALDTDITYEAVPVFYWACAESPITILCICLPAMLPLARYLGSEYFEPLAQKVSSILSSRASHSSFQSKTGDFVQHSDANGIQLESTHGRHDFRGTGSGDLMVRPSGDSNRGMLNLSTTEDNYAAHIRSHEATDPEHGAVPHLSIRVDKDIRVSRREG